MTLLVLEHVYPAKMDKSLIKINQKDGFFMNPPSPPTSFPTPYTTTGFSSDKDSTSNSSLSSFDRISPVFLLVIIILAIIFFVSGLLHLLIRFLIKRPVFSAIYHSNRFQESSSTSHSLQRQLQQLFRQHDSGLDQSFIDALPVFFYRDIMGLKEPFDCAVCLCEFSHQDKLRLIPMCSHAFHIDCIDTWLLSNSTCPLCRGTLLGTSTISIQFPIFNFNSSSMHVSSNEQNVPNNGEKAVHIEERGGSDRRVFSVRLGKFRSLNEGINGGESSEGEVSRCNLDARRCYSMGTVRYVVDDTNLQVALSNDREDHNGHDSNPDGDVEGKKLRGRTRGDSFSVSKIWLWSKKNRFPSESSPHLDLLPLALNLPSSDRTEIIRAV